MSLLKIGFLYCRNMPGHASREVLIIFGSLTTCDPGNVIETIQVHI
jgi:transcription initiation factor TFIIH subunit 2